MERFTPKTLIEDAYGTSRNFMTPEVLAYGWVRTGQMAYELSKGTGFDGEPIYGVTVVEKVGKGGARRHDLSEMHTSWDAAMRYVINMRQGRVPLGRPDQGVRS